MKNILELRPPQISDLLAMEEALNDILKDFISFKHLKFYFPRGIEVLDLTYIADEDLILVPVEWQEKRLAMLRIEGVKKKAIEAFLPHLQSLLKLILERLFLEKLQGMELKSGLASEANFFKFMEDELSASKEKVNPQNGNESSNAALYRFCLGLIILRWQDEHLVIRQHDHDFAAGIYDRLAEILINSLPDKVLAAPIGKYEGRHDFGLILNASGRQACFKLAKKIMQNMEQEIFIDPLSGRKYSPRIYAGHALYPQDMFGDELGLPYFEQILRIRNRALLSAKLAKDLGFKSLEDRIMSYASIPSKAGRIIEYIKKDKIRINLGKHARIREGMRFLVWGNKDLDGEEILKGQISIIKSGETESIAELIYLNQAAYLPQRGDRLSLVQVKAGIEDLYHNVSVNSEEEAKLLSHAEFLEEYALRANKADSFAVIILRAFFNDEDISEVKLKKIKTAFLNNAKKLNATPVDLLIAQYAQDRLIIFWQNAKMNELEKIVLNLAEEENLIKACGIAQYPYLNFSREDIEKNVLKALEYGELLAEPHIGIFNSMAITISADKKFSIGDEFGAIEEYKLALLADNTNILAANSLAVSLAALGKKSEAKKLWLEALNKEIDEDLKAKIYYNLGTLYQKEGEPQEAAKWYRACLRSFQKHVFAWLRIGQLNELKGKLKSAKRYYLCAANLSDVNSEVFAIAQRYLARLDIGDSEDAKARNILHQLLHKNPFDAASMNLLAELYLKENGDPSISEMLARKSLQIKDSEEGWHILARSLALRGKEKEAAKSFARAEKRAKYKEE